MSRNRRVKINKITAFECPETQVCTVKGEWSKLCRGGRRVAGGTAVCGRGGGAAEMGAVVVIRGGGHQGECQRYCLCSPENCAGGCKAGWGSHSRHPAEHSFRGGLAGRSLDGDHQRPAHLPVKGGSGSVLVTIRLASRRTPEKVCYAAFPQPPIFMWGLASQGRRGGVERRHGDIFIPAGKPKIFLVQGR